MANTQSRSIFGKVVVVILLLILLAGCLGMLSICYIVATNGLDVRIKNDQVTSAQATTSVTTSSGSISANTPNIVDALCMPFSNAISQVFRDIFNTK
jgi:hypothetical protein